MAGGSQHQQIEECVRVWLDCQSDTVRYVSWDNKAYGQLMDLDFLVLQPFPLAIEVMPNSSPQAMRTRAKRFLAQRIALAERFGRYVPVILVVPKDYAPGKSKLFADKVIEVEALPPLEKVRGELSLDPLVQRIIETGDPGEIKFSEADRVNDDWEGSVNLMQISDEHADFPANSLAKALHGELAPLRIESGALPSKSRPNNERPWYINNAKWSKEFDCTLHAYVEKGCGGKVYTKRVRVDELGSTIQRSIWEAPNGRRVVLRRQSVAGANLPHKVPELVAEAWMARVFISESISGHVLLLGSGFEKSRAIRKIRGREDQTPASRPPDVHLVNVLEGAGWSVHPWDFTKDEPNFIKHLKELGND